MKKVAILSLSNTVSSVMVGSIDILSTAGRLWPDLVGAGQAAELFQTMLVAPERSTKAVNSNMRIIADHTFDNCPVPDIVFVPPIWLAPGDDKYLAQTAVFEWLREMAARRVLLTSACTGSLLLAAANLLDGVAATTHWAFAKTMRDNHPRVNLLEQHTLIEARTTTKVITAGGHAAWQNLVLHLIRIFGGEETAMQSARLFLLQGSADSQQSYACGVAKRFHDDALIRKAEGLFEKDFAAPDVVARARVELGLTERTFSRRFKRYTGYSPLAYVQGLRLEASKKQLAISTENIETIATAVGYEDVASFRRLFKKHTGLTPGAFRRKFAIPVPRAG